MSTEMQRGALDIPEGNEWSDQIQAGLELLKLDDKPLSLVLYTDGGCRPTPRGNGGWGIFGYVHHPDAPKQGHGGKGFVPTAQGLLPTTAGTERKPEQGQEPVTVVQYIECRGGLQAPATNNEAEVVALYHGLRIVEKLGVMNVFFRLDSEYALQGIKEYAPKWAKSGWRKGDGTTVANHLWWRDVLALFQRLVNNGVKFRFEWVKGHSDSMGNFYADFLATSGIFGTQNGYPEGVFRLYSPKGYWNHSPDRHTFLSDPLWYLDPETIETMGEHRLYYTGNHFGTADDSDAGVPKSKSFYAIAALKTGPKYLDTVLDFLNKTAGRGVNHYVIGRLDQLFARMAHRELTEFAHRYLCRPNEAPNVVFGTETALARVTDPPLLIYRAVDHLQHLQAWLTGYVNNAMPPAARLTDITSLLFETTQENPKKPPVTKTILKPGDRQYLDIPVTYHWLNEDRQVKLRFLIGTEFPSRNFFSAIAEKNPKVQIITMPEPFDTPGFRHRLIIEADGEYYIREASHSNLWFGA